MDSNPRFLSEGNCRKVEQNRLNEWAFLGGPRVRIHLPPALSPLRTSFSGGKRGKVRGDDKGRSRDGEYLKRNRWFESGSLQRGVRCEPKKPGWNAHTAEEDGFEPSVPCEDEPIRRDDLSDFSATSPSERDRGFESVSLPGRLPPHWRGSNTCSSAGESLAAEVTGSTDRRWVAATGHRVRAGGHHTRPPP